MLFAFTVCVICMGILATAGVLLTAFKNKAVLGGFFKVAATGTFLISSVLYNLFTPSVYGVNIILIASLITLGDVAMSIMEPATKKSLYRLIGMGLFLFGYGLAAVNMSIRSNGNWTGIAALIIIAIVIAVGITQIKLMDNEALGTMKFGVIVYMSVISLLIITSFFTKVWYAFEGAFLLYVSDTWIAHSSYGKLRFLKPSVNEVGISGTFYLGLIALFAYLLF